MIAEGNEGKKIFLGAIKLFSVSNQEATVYCHAAQLVYCRYISCSEVGFCLYNRVAGMEIMIPLFQRLHSQPTLWGLH